MNDEQDLFQENISAILSIGKKKQDTSESHTSDEPVRKRNKPHKG